MKSRITAHVLSSGLSPLFFSKAQGFTLIQLLMSIAIATTMLLFVTLNLKPHYDQDKRLETLSQTLMLYKMFENYYKVYGGWPGDQGGLCENSLSELKSDFFPAARDINAYGQPIIISCEADHVLQPLLIEQYIPREDVDYFKTYFKDLDSFEVDDNTAQINLLVQPAHYFYYVGAVSAQPLYQHHEFGALVELPDQCLGASRVDIAVAPESVCTAINPSDFSTSRTVTLQYRPNEELFSELFNENEEELYPLYVRIERQLLPASFRYNDQPCEHLNTPEQNCSDSVPTEDTQGFLISGDAFLSQAWRLQC